jgi:Ig-like domain-containing protein/type IX secretion system substrate protein
MKQLYSCFFTCLFIILSCVAQGQKLHLAKAGSITGDGSQTCKIATDSKGFVYIAGSFTGTTLSFNGTTIPGNGNSVYLAKYDTSENLIWVKTYGGNATLNNIAIDKNSDIFLVGNFSSSSSFDTYTLTSTGKQDVFYTKISSAGNVIWAKQAGGDSTDIGMGISTDQFDNVYLCGNFFSDTFSIGTQQINIYKQGTQDCFYAKLDANGNAIWLQAPSIANVYSSGASFSLDKIKAADDGSVYLSGLAIPNTLGGGDTLSFTPLIPEPVGPPIFDISKGIPIMYGYAPSWDINFFVKLDSSGVTIKQFAQPGLGRGSKEVNFVFRKQYLYAAFTGVSLNYDAFMLQKEDTATSLIPNNKGQYSISGSSNSSFFYLVNGVDMDMGKNGNIFSVMTASPPEYTALILNDSNLNFLDSLRLPLLPTTITADTNSNIIMFAGTYNSTQSVTIGTDILPATAGNTNVFFIITRNTLKPVSVKVNDTVVCTGQTVQLHALVSNGYPSYKYAWKPTTGLSDSTISNPTVSPAGDSVQYIVTVTDSIGETATDTATVYVNSSNTLTITNPAPVCAPATIDLSSSSIIAGSRAGIKLEYFKNQAATDTLRNPTSIDSSGTYYIKASSAIGCNTPPVITLVSAVVNPQPGIIIAASGPTTFCGGDSVVLTAPAALSHLWISGDTTASVVAKTTGFYEVTSTNNYGCSSTNGVEVSAGPLPAKLTLVSAPATKLQTVNGNTPITNIVYTAGGGATSLVATNLPHGFTSNFSNDTLTISGSLAISTVGTVSFYVNTVGGCSQQADTCTLTIIPYQAVLVSAPESDQQSICPNSAIVPIKYYVADSLGLSNALIGTGLPAGVTLTVSGDTIIISGTPTPTTGIYYYNIGGYYVSGYINIDPASEIRLSLSSPTATTSQSLCINTSITPITYASGDEEISINNLPTGVTGTYSNGTVTISGSPSAATGSPFTYSITTTDGCIRPVLTGTIIVNPILTPVITLGTATYSSVNFNWTAITGATGYSLTYTINDGAVQNAGTISATTYTINSLSSGSSVVLTVLPVGSGCFASATATNTTATCVSPPAPISGGDQQQCAQNPLQTLIATATAAIGTVQWYDFATGGNIVSTPDLNAIGSITYYAQAIDNNGCSSVTRTPVILTISAQPSLVINNPAPVCSPNTVDITATAITTGTSFSQGTVLSYYSDANATTAQSNPNAIANTGTYYIKAAGSAGCVDIAPVTVTINTTPAMPAISQTLDTLSSNASSGNQWYMNGNILSGEDHQRYIASQDGYYSLRITDNGCMSDSASLYVVVPATDSSNSDSSVGYRPAYPNPSQDNITINYTTTSTEDVGIALYDFSGQQVKILLNASQVLPGNYSLTFSGASLRPGTYFIHYTLGNKKYTQEVVILPN